MIKKTKEYDMFKFREDNRAEIDQLHVLRLKESIEIRNMLELRPIIVNQDFEIIDGQHRLLAAKMLDVEIYYEVQKSLDAQDVILLNTAKAWKLQDYLNFYCVNGFEEYIKLKNYLNKNNITLTLAINICIGRSKKAYLMFKNGEFKFINAENEDTINVCWQTIENIKKMNGYGGAHYLKTTKFWKALVKLVTHENFNASRWFNNLPKMIERFMPKVSEKDYLKLMMDVHNWHNSSRVNLVEEF